MFVVWIGRVICYCFASLSFNSISTGFYTKQSKCTYQNWPQSRRMQRLVDLLFTALVSSRTDDF